MRFNSIHILLLISALALACTKSTTTAEIKKDIAAPSPVATTEQKQPGGVEQELERRLKILSEGAQGKVGLSVVHIESGKSISTTCRQPLPSSGWVSPGGCDGRHEIRPGRG